MPRFNYAMTINQGQQQGLTYVTVGTSASLVITVTNPGAPVAVSSISFMFVVGTYASNLIAAPGDITVSLPKDWHDLGNYSYAPPLYNPVIGTDAVTFSLNIKANLAPGTATLGVKEVTTGTQFLTPAFNVTKMPAGFVLANLSAQPTAINRGDVVNLTWTAAPGQSYTVSYPGFSGPVTSPGQTASYRSPPLDTTQPQLTFIVTSSQQSGGETITASAYATVNVGNPQVLEFRQPPHPLTNGPVALHWKTLAAASCELWANGVMLSNRIPVNSPPDGYLIPPLGPRTTFQLVAVNGLARIQSSTITVVYFKWTPQEIPWISDFSYSLSLSADGTLLYVVGMKMGITVYDTQQAKVVQKREDLGQLDWNFGGALSPDGRKLYVMKVMQPNNQLVVYDAANLAAGFTPLANGMSFTMAPDGNTIYVLTMENKLVTISTSGTVISTVDLPAAMMTFAGPASPDGRSLFLLRADRGSSDNTVEILHYDTSTRAIKSVVAAANFARPGISLDSKTLYVSSTAHKVQPYSIPDGVPGTPITIPGAREIDGIFPDPTGAGLYVGVSYPSTPPPGAVYFVDPATGFQQLLPAMATGLNTMAIKWDGSRAYFGGLAFWGGLATDKWAAQKQGADTQSQEPIAAG